MLCFAPHTCSMKRPPLRGFASCSRGVQVISRAVSARNGRGSCQHGCMWALRIPVRAVTLYGVRSKEERKKR